MNFLFKTVAPVLNNGSLYPRFKLEGLVDDFYPSEAAIGTRNGAEMKRHFSMFVPFHSCEK